MTAPSIADKMPDALGLYDVMAEANMSQDIITAIMEVLSESWTQTREAAQLFKAPTAKQSAALVWEWVRKNIRYQVDEPGRQYIKTPAATVRDRFGDCKAYSIFIASVLMNLGHAPRLRFVGYRHDQPNTFTHVFVMLDGLTVDACINRFNHTTPYKNFTDMPTEIIKVSGPAVGFIRLKKKKAAPAPALRTAPMPPGANTTKAPAAPAAPANTEPQRQQLKSQKQRKTKVGRFLQKAGNTVKKIVTTPIRAMVDAKLPAAAPFFLYLYMNDTQAKTQPREVQKKRNKAKAVAKFIVNTLQMKEENFYKDVRKGIEREYKKTPEEVLRPFLTGAAATSAAPKIGLAESVAVAAIGALTTIIATAIANGAPEPDFSDEAFYMEGIGFIFKKKAGAQGGKKSALGLKDFPDPAKDFARPTTRAAAAPAATPQRKTVIPGLQNRQPAPANTTPSAQPATKKTLRKAAKATRKVNRQEKRAERKAEGRDILSRAKSLLGGQRPGTPQAPTPIEEAPVPDTPQQSSGGGSALPLLAAAAYFLF